MATISQTRKKPSGHRSTRAPAQLRTPERKSALLVRSALGWKRATFARLLPISERQLATIEKRGTASEPTQRRLQEVKRIVDALSEVMDNKSIGGWMLQPNEAFGGLKPLEVIERGESDRIWQLIFHLRSGVSS